MSYIVEIDVKSFVHNKIKIHMKHMCEHIDYLKSGVSIYSSAELHPLRPADVQ